MECGRLLVIFIALFSDTWHHGDGCAGLDWRTVATAARDDQGPLKGW